MASEVSIISNAIALLGYKSINSFDDTSEILITARRLYAELKLELLGSYPWRFAMESKNLDLLSIAPSVEDWSYAFSFPADPTKIFFYRTRPITTFEIFENKIFTNVNELAMDYVYSVTEDKFPTYFTAAFTYQLAALLSMPASQNVELTKLWSNKGERKLLQAMAIDGQQHPNYMIVRDELYSAHFVGNSLRGNY